VQERSKIIKFQWVKDVSIAKIINVEEPSRGHFYWPDLDVDLGLNQLNIRSAFLFFLKGIAFL